jgi:hypothetical protein
MRIFEIANKAGALRHYVWSSLPCVSKVKFKIQYDSTHFR